MLVKIRNLIFDFVLDLAVYIKSPSPECYTTFCGMTIYIDTLHSSDIVDPFTEFGLITE